MTLDHVDAGIKFFHCVQHVIPAFGGDDPAAEQVLAQPGSLNDAFTQGIKGSFISEGRIKFGEFELAVLNTPDHIEPARKGVGIAPGRDPLT